MPEGVALRRAGPEDWPAIARTHIASWRSAYRGIYPDHYLDHEAEAERNAYWRETLPAMEAEQDAVFIAEAAGRPVGFACLRRSVDPAGPLLDNLHVLPERKGQGIGRALIARAAEWLVGQDPEATFQLLVWKDNLPARRFYARLGGEEVEEFEAEFPSGGTGTEIRVRWERAAVLVEDKRVEKPE